MGCSGQRFGEQFFTVSQPELHGPAKSGCRGESTATVMLIPSFPENHHEKAPTDKRRPFSAVLSPSPSTNLADHYLMTLSNRKSIIHHVTSLAFLFGFPPSGLFNALCLCLVLAQELADGRESASTARLHCFVRKVRCGGRTVSLLVLLAVRLVLTHSNLPAHATVRIQYTEHMWACEHSPQSYLKL